MKAAVEAGVSSLAQARELVKAAGCPGSAAEQDHHGPVANGGVTSYRNVGPLCWPHHRMKTGQDRDAGLVGRRNRPDRP